MSAQANLITRHTGKLSKARLSRRSCLCGYPKCRCYRMLPCRRRRAQPPWRIRRFMGASPDLSSSTMWGLLKVPLLVVRLMV